MSARDEPDPFDELPILGEIGTELERIIATQERNTSRLGGVRRALASWRGPRLLALAGAVAIGGTGVALAASGVLMGSPVKPTGPLVATAGQGIPLPGGSRLLPLRVPDPAGGLPWGVRIVRTTRSELCVQIGRVEDGQLGELGIDGSFGNDGRFHPVPADNLTLFSATCSPPGATYSDLVVGLDASAAGAPALQHGDTADRRIISFGLLGPDASSLTYTTDGSAHTLTPLAGLGAYLIVQAYSSSVARTDGACANCVGESSGNNGDTLPYPQTDPADPVGAVKSITYRLGGHSCVDDAPSGQATTSQIDAFNNAITRFRRSCGLSEGAPPNGPPLPDLRTLLNAHLQTHGDVITGAELTFRSPVAITKEDQQYLALVRSGSRDFGYAYGNQTATNRDYRRGATVSIPIEQMLASVASRTVTIEVDYIENLPGIPDEHATLGTITIRERAGTHPAPVRLRRPLLKIKRRTALLGLRVSDPAGGPPWGVALQITKFGRFGPSANVEIGRVVKNRIGLLGVAGAFGNDNRFHPASPTNRVINPWGYQVSGSFAHPNLETMRHVDLTIPGSVSAEPYCAFCTNSQLRTLVAGYAGSGATAVTLNGEDTHETERLSPSDSGIYLFVLRGRWNRRLEFTITASCRNGKQSSGPANSRAGTGKPACAT